MRCRIFKYLYYLSYEQLLFKRKKQFFIVCFVMHIRRCRVEQDWSTRPRIQTETKKNLEPQQSRLLHMLIRGQILEDTLYNKVMSRFLSLGKKHEREIKSIISPKPRKNFCSRFYVYYITASENFSLMTV